MQWFELSARTDAEGAEAAAALLNEYTPNGAVVEQMVTPEPGEEFDPARAYTVRAFFNDTERDSLMRAETALWHLSQLRAIKPQTREIKEEDWAHAWKKHYTILHIGKRLVIKPSWLDYSARDGEVIVELDPGMAFGTGLHPTTRLCMIALEKYLIGSPRVIDVGTGSGILSITAAKLGARKILALDTDIVAVETAKRNIAFNHAENIVRVEQGSIDENNHRNLFDVACINILAEVICDLASALASALRYDGIVIASGILDYKADDVIDALNAVGVEVIEKTQEDDWVALVGAKRK